MYFIMSDSYINFLKIYITPDKLPIYTVQVKAGRHPDRLFHGHDFMEIVLILEGTATHLVDNVSSPVSAGDILIIRPGVKHAYTQCGTMGLINIAYNPSKLSIPVLDSYSLPLFQKFFHIDGPVDSEDIARPVITLDADGINSIFSMFNRLHDELNSFRPGNFFCSLTIFMEILMHLARMSDYDIAKKPAHFLIGDSIALMNRNYSRYISLDELAQAAKMSRRNFTRQFKSTIGKTPVDYLLQIRIEHACEQLSNSNKSISEIAVECGFCDGNYFCHKFKAVKEITPNQFRQARAK
jgi:AraC-like DNA-binding protein